MQNQLLLLEDVEDLGRSGDIVKVKPGYSRNFLLPQKKAVVADKFTLRMQSKLQAERSKQAEADRNESEELAARIHGREFCVEVKVDPDGHMYGSVAVSDLIRLFAEEGIELERRNIPLVHPIKTLGAHSIQLKLKEGVPAQVTLHIVAEGYIPPSVEEMQQPVQE